MKLDEEMVAQKCQSLTAEMLRIVIDTALTEKFGPSWFGMYKTDYNKQTREKNIEREAEGKSKIPEMYDNVKSVKDFDFQACIKLFVFMYDKYGSAVIEKYNLSSNEFEIKRITGELKNFRNKVSHKVETGYEKLTKNDCEVAIVNMKSLVSFFPDICDSKTNETYKNEIYNIAFELYKTNKTQICYFSNYEEFNGISDEKLLTACAKLSIHPDYYIDDNGNKKLSFYSFDVENDIKRILLAIDDKSTQQNAYSKVFAPPKGYYDSINKNKKKKSKLFYIVPVIILIIALALIIYEIVGSVKSSNEEVKEVSRQVSEHQADSSENITGSTTSSMTTTAKSSSNSSTNQIPDEFKTKFKASKPDWEEDLSVGETNLHGFVNNVSTIWDNVRGYSEDTSIATVGDDLIVTAKAKGVVKVLYVGEFMGEDRTYIIEYTVR